MNDNIDDASDLIVEDTTLKPKKAARKRVVKKTARKRAVKAKVDDSAIAEDKSQDEFSFPIQDDLIVDSVPDMTPISSQTSKQDDPVDDVPDVVIRVDYEDEKKLELDKPASKKEGSEDAKPDQDDNREGPGEPRHKDQQGYHRPNNRDSRNKGRNDHRNKDKDTRYHNEKRERYKDKYGKGGGQKRGGPNQKHQQSKQKTHKRSQRKIRKKANFKSTNYSVVDSGPELVIGNLQEFDLFNDKEKLNALVEDISSGGAAIMMNAILETPLMQLVEEAKAFGVEIKGAPNRLHLVDNIIQLAFDRKIPLHVNGVMELTDDGYGLLTLEKDNYRIKSISPFVHKSLVSQHGLKRGHIVTAQIHPHGPDVSCPFVVKIVDIISMEPEEITHLDPFEDLVPYYPLQRILLETTPDAKWDNGSMRVVDLLTPIGLGQRGLIVAPPRTGKTVLLQGIANSIAENNPEVHLIVLLVDERPEEVTDFRRQTKGEVISSTFDEPAESHVHAAEMVIEKARRMCEAGKHVVILLDSITRLARAYNAIMPNSGKILSGGVEATALQKPKRFFGTARNIEGGGSVTIIGTALIETGSRMDEVIFEEFKGTGNMELHLDRSLVDKRIFPAINLEKSGTRKEELLYHPDEMQKIYGLRRAMKGVPSLEAMEMLIKRVRKTKTNAEFLMGLSR